MAPQRGPRSPDCSPRSVHRRRCLQEPKHHHDHKRRRAEADDDRRQERDDPATVSSRRESEPAAATKVSLAVGGFGRRLSAHHLADYLESEARLGPVWRCRLKARLTPHGSYPDFQLPLPLPAGGVGTSSPDGRVRPHAFVHFARPDAARDADAFFRTARPSAHHRSQSARRRSGTAQPPMLFPGSRIEAGDLAAAETFVAEWSAPGGGASALDFVVDPSEACCRALFARNAAFTFPDSDSSSRGVTTLRCDVKLEFPVRDVAGVVAFEADDSLLLRLSAAPLLYYRTAGDDFHAPGVPYDLIHDDDDDPWVRTTDVTPNAAVGRCAAYRVSFSFLFWPTMRLALEYMRRQGVPVEVRRLSSGRRRGLTVRDEDDDGQVEFGRPAHDMFFCVQHAEGLTFPELYLVNVLLHNGVVGRHQLTPEFVGLLRRERDDDVNVAALTELLGEEGSQVFNDVCSRLKKAQDRAATNVRNGLLISRRRKVAAAEADSNVEVRRLIITPTRAYCMPPQLERSNRVIRHYRHVADRFLRVTFMDEGRQPLNSGALNLYVAPIARDQTSPPHPPEQKTTVYRRVRAILTEGFCLCGRKYSLLAFSPNQLREKSAWFFAEDGATTTASIRAWMGRFFPIRNVAKHAARMGQCFTSSYATVTMRPGEVDEHLEDVVRNGYNFSDGVGKITPDLALEVAERLPLTDSYVPSAFQIRYAGFKGVVAVSPSPGRSGGGGGGGRRVLSLRPSMKKFECTHTVLEVVSWTKPQPAFLNRQIVTLLSSLGVPDAVFWELQQAMVRDLDMILSDSDVAYEVVTRCCPELGSTAALMLGAGFDPATEPHLRAMLLAIKSSQLQGLLKKAKIFVPEGRWLMGCVDELGILEHGQCFIRASTPSLNHRFLTKNGPAFHSERRNNAEVVVGTVVMAKNPCLHPGDVRILEAVDVPELYHLMDCLVFPRRGERPHANEASGSDLDGDVFFVTWDQNLVPPGKKSCPPMDYSPAEAELLPREVQQHDTIDFYLESMLNDNLGRISNAHVAHADRSDDGAMDPNCIELAKLAAIAVDSAKTGKVVRMPTSLHPKEYPDFMLKEDDMSYRSEKILGRLYRSIIGAYDLDFVSQGTCASDEIPYDTDLEVFGASAFFEDAWQIKCSYEAQLNALLNQYGVRTEAELVTGEIWSLTGKKFQYVLKERLHYAYSQLHKEFRIIFESIGDIGLFSNDKKNLLYEMKASAWYQAPTPLVHPQHPSVDPTASTLSAAAPYGLQNAAATYSDIMTSVLHQQFVSLTDDAILYAEDVPTPLTGPPLELTVDSTQPVG
ncbi:hypothetical protein BS78_07G083000 [Paspalum vaginatum]|nr:hypothetical protein BS78_07G083000 [Paspalum vaginatum]